MNITHSDLLEGVSCARKHIEISYALIQNNDINQVVSVVGLLVNSRPPEHLSESAAHIFQICLEYARNAEINAAGSSIATLEYTIRLLKSQQNNEKIIQGRSFKKQDISNLLSVFLDEKDLHSIAKLLELAGASRYSVERSPSRFDSVEFVDNYQFTHVSKAIDGKVIMSGARVMVADAYVENVSEIHKLLEYCGKEKERLIICCRGMSDDVMHTLAVNRARGTLAAYGIIIPFDENEANTLVDIATILGGDVISSLKGQLLSTVDGSMLPRAKYALLHGNVLEINCENARKRTDRLCENIKEKLESAPPEAKEPLEKRLKRLSGTTMVVRLEKNIQHQVRCEKWDIALRTIRAATRGVIEVNDQLAWPNRKIVPLLSKTTAHNFSYKLLNHLKKLFNQL